MLDDKDVLPDFKLDEAEDTSKVIFTIYGEKGEGKTTMALSFPGKIACLSFDRKSSIIKKDTYKNDSRIKVYDMIKYLDEDPNFYTKSALITYKYCQFVLEELAKGKSKPDWIVIDGLEIFSKIGEMVMRYNNNLKPFQGVINRNIWKERQLIMRKIHNRSRDVAIKGVVYTTYTQYDEIVEEGTIKTKAKVPKWTDVILWETDIVIYAYAKQDEKGKKFFINCVSSKMNDIIKTGHISEITNKKLPIDLNDE